MPRLPSTTATIFICLTSVLTSASTSCAKASEQIHIVGEPQARPIDSLLFEAIRIGNANTVKGLLAKGANPNATEADAWPALVEAAQGSLDIVKLLLAKGATIDAAQPDQGWTPLIQAITSHKDDIALYLLSKGANPSKAMTDHATPLHMAIRFGDLVVARELLRRKVDVNVRTIEGPQALHNPSVDLPVDKAFEPGFRFSGRTPLFEIVQTWGDKPAFVRLLLDAGADPRVVDDNGWTLLHDAAKTGSIAAVNQLLKMGLDPNARSRQGYTPLHVAMESGFGVPVVPVIQSLLRAGADPTIANKNGQTPEDLLREEAKSTFASGGRSASANAVSSQGRYALAIFNRGLQALHPGAKPIEFTDVPVVDGWSIYAPLKFGEPFDASDEEIEVKVKLEAGMTLLSLIYRPDKQNPHPTKVGNLYLNSYEPLTETPAVLEPNVERIFQFARAAGSLGGAVHLSYSYQSGSSSGGGDLGDPAYYPNPGIYQDLTPKGTRIGVLCEDALRPVEFRIDQLIVDGKELVKYRGKILHLPIPTGKADPNAEMGKNATEILTLPKSPRETAKVKIKFSSRFEGNKKWFSQSMDF